MISYLPLSAVEVTNQCVVVCDLRKWTGPESPAWQVLRGYQDDRLVGLAPTDLKKGEQLSTISLGMAVTM
jgi:hypothetical protein